MNKHTNAPRKKRLIHHRMVTSDPMDTRRNMFMRIAELDAEYTRMQEQLRKIVVAARKRRKDH